MTRRDLFYLILVGLFSALVVMWFKTIYPPPGGVPVYGIVIQNFDISDQKTGEAYCDICFQAGSETGCVRQPTKRCYEVHAGQAIRLLRFKNQKDPKTPYTYTWPN
jgi:hypothetical protein